MTSQNSATQGQPEQSEAFDAWSLAHGYKYQDSQGARVFVSRGRMEHDPEATEVHFAVKPGEGGHLVFLPLAEVEALRDRLTEIVDETRRGPVSALLEHPEQEKKQ